MIHILPIWRNAILFISFKGRLDGEAFKIVNTYPGRRYSATIKRYYIPYAADALEKITLALKEVADVDVSEWSEVTKHPKPIHLKSIVEIPPLYRETLVKMRYSAATIDNYLNSRNSFFSE